MDDVIRDSKFSRLKSILTELKEMENEQRFSYLLIDEDRLNLLKNEGADLCIELFMHKCGDVFIDRENVEHARKFDIEAVPIEEDDFGWLVGSVKLVDDDESPIITFS